MRETQWQVGTLRNEMLAGLALFASLGTLLCCALPITLVTLGFGSTVAALTMELPALSQLSALKTWLFGVSGVLLALGWLMLRMDTVCPADPDLAEKCATGRARARIILWIALVTWMTGTFFAYLLLPLQRWMG